jgi:hypothetical protein
MLISEGTRKRGEISRLQGVRKIGIQHQTSNTPTNNAPVTSKGNNLQTIDHILVWWRPLEILWQAIANGHPKIRI